MEVVLMSIKQHDPIYLSLFLGVAGWLSAVFLMLFFFVLFDDLYKSVPALMLIGSLLCTGAWFIYSRDALNEFYNQLSFSFSLTGQGMLLFGVSKFFDNQDFAISQFILWTSALLYWQIKDLQHRVWSSLWVVSALLYQWHFINLDQLIIPSLALMCGLFWLFEIKLIQNVRSAKSINIALFLLTSIGFFVSHQHGWMSFRGQALSELWISVIHVFVTLIIAISLFVYQNQRLPISKKTGSILIGAIVLIGLLSFFSIGLAVSLLLILIAFFNSNRWLFLAASCLLISYFSYFYYDLQQSLLNKSILLTSLGSILLLARFLFYKYATENVDKRGVRS
jgi:uncharacterized membrane protein